MNVEQLSRKCIEFYFQIYNIQLLYSHEKIKQLEECVIELLYKSNKFGYINFDIYHDTNVLEINLIEINESRPYIPLKLTKILLLYIFSLHTNINIIKLNASPSTGNKLGKEFCLLCFYEQLGFSPTDEQEIEEINTLTKICSSTIESHIIKNLHKTCLLCICQKNNNVFKKEQFRRLQVRMSVLFPKLLTILMETYIEIEKLCKS